jgi:ATP-dependent DNA helicase RecQ
MENIQLEDSLKQIFGFSSFRAGQKEAIRAILDHGRVLTILPTGHGKSLLYQLPATLFSGMTIVISPLLALMRDQLNQLNYRFSIPSASINSDQTVEENAQIRCNAPQAKYRLLFVAPEQLDNMENYDFLLKLPVSFVVIDEAHCISTWGHDFRPSYRQIIRYVHAMNQKTADLRVLALTATADSRTEEDIKKQLVFDNRGVTVIRRSMDRPNLSLSVVKVPNLSYKLEACLDLVEKCEGAGLIYCATRENSELCAEFLKKAGINAESYHAGYQPEHKKDLQKKFLADTYKVLCATNALGMGIDKQNLRYIIHFDFPGSITAYYQEIGRAGRDGMPAKGILLYDAKDRKIQEHFIRSSQPTSEDFHKVLQAIGKETVPPHLTKIKSLTGLHPTLITVIVAELIEQGFLCKVLLSGKQAYQLTGKRENISLERYTRQFAVKSQELEKMVHYAEQATDCSMALLRNALGDSSPSNCSRCYICSPQSFRIPAPPKERCLKTEEWLSRKPIVIKGNKRIGIQDGIAVLDGAMGSTSFRNFMRERMKVETMDPYLLKLIVGHINKLHQMYAFSALIPIPSRTWLARNSVLQDLQKETGIPVLPDLLIWKEIPKHRQGELLNNDQRRENVSGKMAIKAGVIPSGNILLFDDYTGSQATINEAGGLLLKGRGVRGDVIPFTVASVKWKLGKPGMI